jgi:hypothetical protein
MLEQPRFLRDGDDGAYTLEWRHGTKELYLEFVDHDVEYTKVWGTNIQDEMEVGFVKTVGFDALWEWLQA